MRQRSPEQILGHDLLTQLAFEGYKVVRLGEDTKHKRISQAADEDMIDPL